MIKLDNLLSSENSNSKLFWKTSKQLLNLGQSSNNIPTLTMTHEVAQTDCQKAELLNTYFSSQTKVNDLNKPLFNIEPAQHTLESITIYTQDILDVLRHLDVNKAFGPDLISPRLLREGADFLAYPLFIVFNRSLLQGYFPPTWKDANLTPFQSGFIQDSTTYRRPRWLSWMRHPTGDQEVAGSTPPRSATFFRGD